MEAQPVVHVVDDDDAVRDSLRFLLEAEGYVVRTYSGAQALIEADLPPAGCVITDFQMPGMDGLQLQAALAERGVQLAVVVMTAFGEIPLAVRAMRGGAIDFLEKPFENQSLLEAVRRALMQNKEALQATSQAASAARRISALTPREHEVLDLLVDGKSNKEIARALGTSPRTIDVHRARVFQKLQAGNLPELVHLVLAARGP
jgi:two-component system response regulator FixJ